jgi:hypothetical protein
MKADEESNRASTTATTTTTTTGKCEEITCFVVPRINRIETKRIEELQKRAKFSFLA